MLGDIMNRMSGALGLGFLSVQLLACSSSSAVATAVGGASGVNGGGGTSNTGSTGGRTALDTASGERCGNASGQLFPPSAIWNMPVDSAALDSESSAVINYLQVNHTTAVKFQIDFSIKVLSADANTPRRAFEPTGDFFTPDCDPAPVPVPASGSLEGETGYQCAHDGDCHLIVADYSSCRLYEMWRANFTGNTYAGGCSVVWDLSKAYPENIRGDYCTSADAAGLPIAAHLFNADEIKAGSIKHAIRFVLPNERMRANIYVHPATHSTDRTSGPSSAPPYGARLRLKQSRDVSSLSPGAQVVAQALKKYGMILSDGGNLTFTAASDDTTATKWAEVSLTAQDLKSLAWTDFEMVDGGKRYNWRDGDCAHSPIPN